MRIGHLIAPLTAAGISALSLGQSAYAELLIKVDKSAQHMTVTVDGMQLYDWPVSTGGGGYDTPSGSFKPFRMEIDHRSDEWDDAHGRGLLSLLWPPLPCFQKRLASFPTVPTDRRGKSPTSMP
jgi:hypothetical protein